MTPTHQDSHNACRHPGSRAFTVFAPTPDDVCAEMFGGVPKGYSGEIMSVCCCDCGEVTVQRPWVRKSPAQPVELVTHLT